jgi:outer membrane protein TolC
LHALAFYLAALATSPKAQAQTPASESFRKVLAAAQISEELPTPVGEASTEDAVNQTPDGFVAEARPNHDGERSKDNGKLNGEAEIGSTASTSDNNETQDVRPEEKSNSPGTNFDTAPDAEATADQKLKTLLLSDVIASLYRSYPEILQARQQTGIAAGELMSAYGSYDTKLQGYSLSEPLGFYENYRHGLGVARQTWWGGYASAGYRIGRGDFQPWYKERETNEGGELKLALAQPLLQGREIDPERVAVFRASLAQQAADPIIQQAILDSAKEAAILYWDWVSAGGNLQAQQELLALAEERGKQFKEGVEAGKFPEVDLILNDQLIAERRVKVLETEQKYRATAFKLALYLRNESGQPLVPDDAWRPDHFPVIQPPTLNRPQDDLAAALGRRPEPKLLQLELSQVQLDRRLARNDMLPRLDVIAEASQDVGEPTSSLNDKGEFELLMGVTTEVPIQRRKARGKLQSTSGKLSQVNEKLRLVQDKIAAELQTAYYNLNLASQVVEQSEVSLRAAVETLYRYRFAFEKGKIDLIYLNLLETKANETEIKLVNAQRDWFVALATMQIALGLDPLDQAMVVASLPLSKVPGPGDLPKASIP